MNLLSRPDALEFFHGALCFVDIEGRKIPSRLTLKQMEHYRSFSNAWIDRALCPAGVVLKLVSQAPVLTLRFVAGAKPRSYMVFDLIINGVHVHSEELSGDGEHELTFMLFDPRTGKALTQEANIELYFPQCRSVELIEVSIESAKVVVKPAQKILTLGDSITQGMDGRHPSATYATRVARVLGMELINQGIGGHIFDDESLDSIMVSPELITIAYGTNDWTRGMTADEEEQTAEAYMDGVQAMYPQSRILLITPIWRKIQWEPSAAGIILQDIREALTQLAKRKKIEVLDGLTAVPNVERCFADGTHPNDEGYGLFAESILAVL